MEASWKHAARSPANDVAAVLATLITEPRLDRTVLYLGGVDVPIEQAVACSENAGAGR